MSLPALAMGLTGASTLVRSVIKNFKYPGRTVVLRLQHRVGFRGV